MDLAHGMVYGFGTSHGTYYVAQSRVESIGLNAETEVMSNYSVNK